MVLPAVTQVVLSINTQSIPLINVCCVVHTAKHAKSTLPTVSRVVFLIWLVLTSFSLILHAHWDVHRVIGAIRPHISVNYVTKVVRFVMDLV